MTGVKKSPVENYVNKNYVLLSSEMSQHLTIEQKGQKHIKRSEFNQQMPLRP
jgi:hypothetical protein